MGRACQPQPGGGRAGDAGACGDGRRELWASPQAWRDGAELRDALDRSRAQRALADELWRVSGEAFRRGGRRRWWRTAQLELRARGGAVAVGLRLQWRQGGLEPGAGADRCGRALDLLRDRTAPLAEALASGLLKDLWAARDGYVSGLILDRSPETSEDRVPGGTCDSAHAEPMPSGRSVWELMEMERHAQLMYTSCGWFFDDISGIETVQIIAYAGRVVQLAQQLFGAEPARRLSRSSWRCSKHGAVAMCPMMGDGAEGVPASMRRAMRRRIWSRWARITRSARSSAAMRRSTRCSATT